VNLVDPISIICFDSASAISNHTCVGTNHRAWTISSSQAPELEGLHSVDQSHLSLETIHGELSHLVPRGFEGVLSESFWLSEVLPIIGPGFSKTHACALYKQGWKYIQDAWSNQHFISPQTALAKFGLHRREFGISPNSSPALETALVPLLLIRNGWGFIFVKPTPPRPLSLG
jgi:hypothetical protein